MGNEEDLHEFRCVSQHHIVSLIEKAVDGQLAPSGFAPTLLVAAHEHALSVASQLARVLHARGAATPTVLTAELQAFDADAHPYNPHAEAWTGSLSGQRILVVDTVDRTRSTLASFIQTLQARVDSASAQAAGGSWAAPSIGVFVLHNKRRPKEADLPAEVMNGRYFSGEDIDNVVISYPFKPDATIAVQPTAHGDHEHNWHAGARRSFEESAMVHRSATPVLHEDQRILSTHYVEEVVEQAVVKQQLFASFQPQVLVSATDDSVAPARILRHHLKAHGCDAVVLTSSLDLYDEDRNPYNPVMDAGPLAQLSGKRVLVVEKVDNTRASLSAFLASLKQRIDAQRAAAVGGAWQEPTLGVFVLNQKDRPKPELPSDLVSAANFFAAETGAADVHLVFPFNLDYRIGSVAA